MATAAELNAVRDAILAAMSAGDYVLARLKIGEALVLLALSPSRHKHGDTELEWASDAEWSTKLLEIIARAESQTALRTAGGIRRTRVNYCRATGGCE